MHGKMKKKGIDPMSISSDEPCTVGTVLRGQMSSFISLIIISLCLKPDGYLFLR